MGGQQSTSAYGDATNAEEIASAFKNKCEGKYVVITGGNSGIGLETARVLALNGAHVVICSRSVSNGEKAIEKIKENHPEIDVITMQLDLASFQSVTAFTTAYLATKRPLHLLINNAGIMACPLTLTTDGFESQFGVNHLGHFLLTTRLLPLLIATGTKECPSRVVNLSSCANWLFSSKKGVSFDDLAPSAETYSSWERYGESKLANILFAKALNDRMVAQGHNVQSVAVHPGIINGTNLNQNTDLANMLQFVSRLYAVPGGIYYMATSRFKTIPQGAATTVFAALSDEVVPGEYYADCHVSDKVHTQALDGVAVARLWEVSEQLVAAYHAKK